MSPSIVPPWPGGSQERAYAGDVAPDDQGLHRLGALKGVDDLDVAHVPDHVFASRTPLPPSMSRASAITARALRVLLNFASPAIVSGAARPPRGGRAACSTAACR